MTDNPDSPIDITHLARLARLDVKDDALQQIEGDLRNIVAMIDFMAAIDTEDVQPMAHPIEQPARLRADSVSEEVVRDKFQAIAPATEDGYYLVPRVVE